MDETMHVTIAANGPYLVYGHIPLAIETIGTNAEGDSLTWEPGRARFPQESRTRSAAAANPRTNRSATGLARNDRAGTIWKLIHQTDDGEVRTIVRQEASNCSSGRLVVRDIESGNVLEPELEPSIALVEDPAKECSGTIWLRGSAFASPRPTASNTRSETASRSAGVAHH